MEFSFMTLRSFRSVSLLALLAVPVWLHAQETTASEDERIEQLVRSEASEWYTPKNSVSVGFRMLTSGVNVRFGNLGAVSFNSLAAPALAGNPVARLYDNGAVGLDKPRPEELDANGNQVTTPGGRYPGPGTDGGDYLSYTPGLTRSWGYAYADQSTARPGYIAMSSYGAVSDGGFVSKEQGASAGVELQFAHAFRKLGKRTELSIVAGLGINGINNSTSGDIQATLLTHTDYYSLNGKDAPAATLDARYAAPSFPTDNPKLETTVPIGATADPSLSTDTTTAGGATVHGLWKIKGAYFMLRLGPSIRTQLSKRFGMSASAGVAGAYVGTSFSAVESMDIPVVGTTVTDTGVKQSDTTKFLAGYYADFNLEWITNDTLALYGGLSAQQFGDYIQTLGDRNALIDLGSAIGIRGGVNIKF